MLANIANVESVPRTPMNPYETSRPRLRKLEEMQIRGEHTSLTKEQKELKKLLGSEKMISDTLIEQMKAVDAKFGLKTAIGKRRNEAENAMARALLWYENSSPLAPMVRRPSGPR